MSGILYVIIGTLFLAILFGYVFYFTAINHRTWKKHEQEKANIYLRFKEESEISMNEIRESTIKLIAKEIHDNVGALLSIVNLQLTSLPAYNETPQLQDAVGLLNDAVNNMREMVHSLDPDKIVSEGLEASIKIQLKRLEKTGRYICAFRTNGEMPNISEGITIIAYRIFQETLNNIIKHAKATHLEVVYTALEGKLKLVISDNGVGYDKELTKGGPGF